MFPLRNFGKLVMPWICFAATYHVLHEVLLVPYFSTIFDFVKAQFRRQGSVFSYVFSVVVVCSAVEKILFPDVMTWGSERLSFPPKPTTANLMSAPSSLRAIRPGISAIWWFSIRYGHQILFCLLFHISVVSFNQANWHPRLSFFLYLPKPFKEACRGKWKRPLTIKKLSIRQSCDAWYSRMNWTLSFWERVIDLTSIE